MENGKLLEKVGPQSYWPKLLVRKYSQGIQAIGQQGCPTKYSYPSEILPSFLRSLRSANTDLASKQHSSHGEPLTLIFITKI
jgi:hypothetical protein